jgi:hypothetical protein
MKTNVAKGLYRRCTAADILDFHGLPYVNGLPINLQSNAVEKCAELPAGRRWHDDENSEALSKEGFRNCNKRYGWLSSGARMGL